MKCYQKCHGSDRTNISILENLFQLRLKVRYILESKWSEDEEKLTYEKFQWQKLEDLPRDMIKKKRFCISLSIFTH